MANVLISQSNPRYAMRSSDKVSAKRATVPPPMCRHGGTHEPISSIWLSPTLMESLTTTPRHSTSSNQERHWR